MNHTTYSGRIRSRSKQPTYTSDKRAKFTQRENKKWIRLMTVLGYVVFVSAPAISLSFYYIYVWDPAYISKYPLTSNVSDPHTLTHVPLKSMRGERDLAETDNSPKAKLPPGVIPATSWTSSPSSKSGGEEKKEAINLATILSGIGPSGVISSESELLSSSSSESSSAEVITNAPSPTKNET